MESIIDLAPDIAGRTRYARNRKESDRRFNQEFFGVAYGDYSRFYDEPGTKYKERDDVFEFQGLEIVIADQIRELLKTHRDKPVVLLDFGGMISFSFLRLAGSPEFRPLVEKGELVFVVSSIDFTIEDGIRTAGQGLNRLREGDVGFINSCKEYVNYIRSDAAELRNIKIFNNFTNQEIELSGNIDILCERYALYHGVKNDVDIYLLAKMMSKDGVMFIDDKNKMQPFISATEEFSRNKKIAHEKGLSNIKLAGLTEQTSDKKMNFKVFSKPQALKVAI